MMVNRFVKERLQRVLDTTVDRAVGHWKYKYPGLTVDDVLDEDETLDGGYYRSYDAFAYDNELVYSVGAAIYNIQDKELVEVELFINGTRVERFFHILPDGEVKQKIEDLHASGLTAVVIAKHLDMKFPDVCDALKDVEPLGTETRMHRLGEWLEFIMADDDTLEEQVFQIITMVAKELQEFQLERWLFKEDLERLIKFLEDEKDSVGLAEPNDTSNWLVRCIIELKHFRETE
jgi:hypothetical protein